MIDTVKFRFPIDKEAYQILLDNSDVHTGFNFKTKINQYVIIKTTIKVGSYVSEKIIRVPRQFVSGVVNYAEIELSMPKFLHGHNVFMIHVSSLINLARHLANDLYTELKLKTDVLTWEIQRIDLCYNWKLKNKEQLKTYLKIFQNLDYARKKKYTYDTSAMYKGSAYTVKIYSKYEEYLAHDYKNLSKINEEYAMEILETAESVLRFEVTIKKPHFPTVFGKHTLHIEDITEDVVLKTLNIYLTKLLRVNNTSIAENDSNYNKLINTFGEVKGRDLFQKLCMWVSDEPTYKESFNSYSYPNRYKFFQSLKRANVSLSGKITDETVSLAIPSEYGLYSEIC